MLRKILSLVLMFSAVFSFLTFTSAADQDLQVSNYTLNFGHEGTEKTLYLTNTNQNSDLLWSAATNVPWIKLEAANGKIENPIRIPANAQYQFSNLWPKLPQPWYFQGTSGIGIDHEGSIYVADIYATEKGQIIKFNKYGEFMFKIDDIKLSYRSRFAFNTNNDIFIATVDSILQFNQKGNFIKKIKPVINGEAQDYFAAGIAIDSKDNIYTIGQVVIGQQGGLNQVSKFDKNGNYLKSFGKEGMGGSLTDGEFYTALAREFGIVADSKGYLYVADNHYHRIQKFDAEGNFIKMWAYGTGDPRWPVWDWQLGELFTIDSHDIIYISHEHSIGIGKFDTEGNSIDTKWQDMNKWWTGNFYMQDAVVDKEGSIYVVDESRRPGIIKFDAQGNELINWRSFGVRKEGYFFYPKAITTDKNGNVYVLEVNISTGWRADPDPYVNRIQKFDSKGRLTTAIDIEGAIKESGLTDAMDGAILRIDAQNNFFYIITKVPSLSNLHSIVVKLDKQGKLLSVWKNDKFRFVKDAVVNSIGELFLTSITRDNDGNSKHSIIKLDNQGNIISGWEKEPSDFSMVFFDGLTVDNKDNLYIIDNLLHKIQKLDKSGKSLGIYNFAFPVNIGYEDIKVVVDEGGNFYFLSLAKLKVYKHDPSGSFLVSFTNDNDVVSGLHYPIDIALQSNGDVCILDNKYNRVQVFSQAVQPIKITVDRSKLPDNETNIGWIEFKNDRSPGQPPIRVEVTALKEVIKDITPPAVTITFPQANAKVSAKGFSFSGTAADASGIQEVAVSSWDYARRKWTLYNQKAAYNPQTTVWNFNLTKDMLTSGSHLLLWAKVTDTQGNISKKSVLVRVEAADTIAPQVLITAPEPNNTVSAEGFSFGGYAFDAGGIDYVKICVSNETKKTWLAAGVNAIFDSSSSQWIFQVTSKMCIPGDILKLWVTAKDSAGNWCAGWQTITVQIAKDTVPPIVIINTPGQNDIVPSRGFIFGGSAFDASGISEIRIAIYNAATKQWPALWAPGVYNQQTKEWSYAVAPEMFTPGKSLGLYVTARDKAGNWQGGWKSISVIVEQDSGIEPQRVKGQEAIPALK